MKRVMQITLAAAVVVLVVHPALAQERQRQRGGGLGGFGGVGTLFLLGQKSVQEELKLSDDQVKKVTELREKQRESFQGLRDLSPEERRSKIQEMTKAQNEALAKILDAKQLKRIKQIALQQQMRFGIVFVLNNEEVAKTLQITDEQKEKIREIQRNAFEEMRNLGRDEEGRKKREEIRKATNEKVEGLLSAEQKSKLKELQGEPFKGQIDLPQFGGGRRDRQN